MPHVPGERDGATMSMPSRANVGQHYVISGVIYFICTVSVRARTQIATHHTKASTRRELCGKNQIAAVHTITHFQPQNWLRVDHLALLRGRDNITMHM